MRYNFFEVLGIAGSGKSTTISALKSDQDNYIYNYSDTKLNIYLLKNLYLYFRVYLKSRKIVFPKSLLLFHILLHNIKRGVISEDDIYVFDQGPIFILCMLIYEIPSMKKIFLLELEKILPYYKGVVYLEAPLHIICDRIEKREQQHRIKNVEREKQKLFLNKYSEIYNSVLCHCKQLDIQGIRIDTSKHSSSEVKEIINAIIKAR